MENVVVKYNEARIWAFYVDSPLKGNPVIIKPGVTEIEKKVWDKMKNDKIVKQKIDEGLIGLVESKTKTGEIKVCESIPTDLSGMKSKDAIAFIEGISELDTLVEIQKLETREQVLKVIKSQIETIKEIEE